MDLADIVICHFVRYPRRTIDDCVRFVHVDDVNNSNQNIMDMEVRFLQAELHSENRTIPLSDGQANLKFLL